VEEPITQPELIEPVETEEEEEKAPPPISVVPFVRPKRSEVAIFFHFLRWVLPYWRPWVLQLLLNIIWVTLSVIPPWFSKFLIDDAFPNKDLSLVYRIFLGLVCMLLLSRFIGSARSLLNYYIDIRVSLDLKRKFFHHLMRLSMTFHQRRPVGEHIFRSSADIDAVMTMITDDLPEMIRATYEFFLILTFTTFLDPMVTVLILLYSIPYTLLAHKLASIVRRFDREQRERAQARDAGMQEGVAGAMVVKTYGRHFHEVWRYVHLTVEMYRANWKRWWSDRAREHITGAFLPWLKTQLVRVYFFLKVCTGELSYGMVFPITSYMDRLTNPIQQIVNYFQQIRISMIPAERILETTDVAPSVVDAPGAPRLPKLRGEVAFDNVAFHYEDGQPILRGVSFTAQPGQKIGIVGHSGAGKSTVVNLLLRLYDPQFGRALVDNYDLRTVKMNSYQEQIGLVMQETYIFVGTIRENLLFGNPFASHEEMEKAARAAEIYDWVMSQPQGFDTELNEGSRLSTGLKQRLGIARAIIRDPAILILDEPTSSLDTETEKRVLETLRRVSQGRTTFIISHRLNTVADADEILVMDAGRIVERGAHGTLIAHEGLYAEMYRLFYGMKNGVVE
jgi:ABC-type multidrug transport system fused ATPase/permease subunit